MRQIFVLRNQPGFVNDIAYVDELGRFINPNKLSIEEKRAVKPAKNVNDAKRIAADLQRKIANKAKPSGAEFRKQYAEKVKAKRRELDRAKELREAGGVDAQLIEEIRQAGLQQEADEEFAEQMRQLSIAEEIHGKKELAAYLSPNNPSQTVEQQIGRQLVQDGVMPAAIPADRVLGGNTTMKPRELGIDGAFKSDSEVRRHALGSLNSEGDLDIDRSDVRTEILSPRGIKEAFKSWYDNIKDSKFAPRRGKERENFNRAAGEYYGQQALLLNDRSPVLDKDRSAHVQNTTWLSGNTMGSDRLIENSRTLTGEDIGQSTDFRLVDTDGQIKAIDYQMGPNPTDNINLNLVKSGSRKYGNSEDIAELTDQMIAAAQELKAANQATDLDSVMTYMVNKGQLPTPRAGFQGKADDGMAPGKFLSNSENLGSVNQDDQHRMAGVLYGMFDDINSEYGMLPTGHHYFDAEKVREYIGRQLAFGKLPQGKGLFSHDVAAARYGRPQKGDVQMNIDIAPKGFLRDEREDYNAQIATPYGF